MKMLTTPISEETAEDLHIGDMVLLSGRIYCGRDTVLPKICKLIEEDTLWEYGIDLRGSVIFHTAVSPAGVGPTSSNKLEIESSFPALSRAGVKLHLGKGAIGKNTVSVLDTCNSVYDCDSSSDGTAGGKHHKQAPCGISPSGNGSLL